MALSSTQQEMIHSSIKHLFVFSNQVDKFKDEIAELRALLENKQLKGSYSQLQQCFHFPNRFIQRLEEQQKEIITIGQVQAYILELIADAISKAAHRVHLSLQELNWNTEKISKICIDPQKYIVPYLSEQTVDSGLHPWEFPPLNERIYKRELVFKHLNFSSSTTVTHVYGKFNLICDPCYSVESRVFLEELPNDFESDEEESEYLDDLKDIAEKIIEEHVASEVRIYFRDKLSIVLKYHPFMNCLLTFEYYFNLCKNRLLTPHFLNQLSDESCELLADPAIIDLIKYKNCSISSVLKLSPHQIRLLKHPVYHALLKEKKIGINCLLDVDEERSRFLIYPPIANLIKQNKLKFTEAKNLPLALKPIFGNSAYNNYLFKKTIDWKQFYSLKAFACDMLKNKAISNLVTDNILTIRDVSHLTPQKLIVLQVPIIHQLLREGLINYKDLVKFSFETIENLERLPYLSSWIKAKFTDLHSLNNNFVKAGVDVFSKRLYQIFNAKPYPYNSTFDTYTSVLTELKQVASDFDTTQVYFIENVLRKFFDYIVIDLQSLLIKALPEEKTFYAECLEKIRFNLSSNHFNWQKVLEELNTTATFNLDKTRHEDFSNTNWLFATISTFFNPKRIKQEKSANKPFNFWESMLNFCKQDFHLPPSLARKPL